MRFIYDNLAGAPFLELAGDSFKHLKAQRKREGELIRVQNLREFRAYYYKITHLARSAKLSLENSEYLPKQEYKARLIWAICDESVIQKALPFLNELGLSELALVYSEYSQRNIKLDFARFDRILASSCEQCGRAVPLKISLQNIDELDEKNTILLDFEGEQSDFKLNNDEALFIGPEGGFSAQERARFKRKISLQTPLILRSQTAIIACATKILL